VQVWIALPGSCRSVRQFDSVWVFLVPLVLFSKYLFEPLSEPLIHERGIVADEKLLATALTPERSHFLEIRRLLSAKNLLDCHCLHLPNFSALIIKNCFPLIGNTATVFGFVIWWFRDAWATLVFWAGVLVLMVGHLAIYSFALRRVDSLPLAYYSLFNVAEWARVVPIMKWLT
jgi:hypothetical protein